MSTVHDPPAGPSPAEIRNGLNVIVRDTLRLGAFVLTCAYLVFTIANPFILPPASRTVVSIMAAVTMLLSGAIFAYVSTVRIPPAHAHYWAASMIGLVLVDLTVHMSLTPLPELTGNFLLLMIAAGCFLLSHAWFAATVACCLSVWAFGVVLNPGPEWWRAAMLQVLSVLVAGFVYTIRYRTYSHYERLKSQLQNTADRLEQRLKFEQTLTQISARFLAMPAKEADAAIHRALEEVGETLKVDHACVCRADSLPSLSMVYEWCGPGVAAQKDILQKVPVEHFPWVWKQLNENHIIGMTRLPDMPVEADKDRRFLAQRGTRSFLCVPAQSGGVIWGMMVLETYTKEVVWSDEVSSLLRVLGEIIVAAVKRQEAEREITNLNQRLEQASRLVGLGEMAAALAHDLTNGLAAMSLQTKGASRKGDRGKLTLEECREYIQDIADQSDRLAKMLITIQRFAMRRDGERRPVWIHQVLDEVEILVAGKLRQRNIILDRTNCEGVPPVLADPSQITLVTMNLVLNAAQAMLETEADQRRITITIDNDGPDFLEVSVKDQGNGVSPDALEKIFEKFYTTKDEGLGLGLAFSRLYIEQHGGKLWCDSTPGQGSDFRFTLPKPDGRLN